MKEVKAVVTGGAGFIGSHLIDTLLKDGVTEVTVLDNFSTGRPQNLRHLEGDKRINLVEIDIGDDNKDLNPYFKNVDYVFHIAALADIVPSIQMPDKYYRSNVHGTFRVLEACKQSDRLKKIVYAASSSCYGIPDEYPTKEDAEIRPEYPYALTKRMGEELLLHWGKVYKLPVVSCRFFNVYGPRSRTSGTYGAVFGVFLAQKLAGKPYTVVGDGNQSRDFTYVTDVAEAVWACGKSNVAQEVFNIGSGNHYKVNYLVELLGGEKTHIPKRPGEPDCTFADITKIKNVIGWTPRVSFEEGVKKLLAEIDYWKEAPVWTPESISKETEAWFKALSR